MFRIDGVIYIILIACLLPYIFTVIAKVVAGFKPQNNLNPREFLANTTGLAARANAVQQNSFESLPLFLASIILAEMLMVNDAIMLLLSIAYIVLRIVYGICYLCNWSTMRTIVWLLSMICPILLLLLTAWAR